MRVLVLSNLYPPNAMGGYELSCRDVVDRWRAAGHEVTVLTTATTVTGVAETPVDEPHVRRELEWYWSDHVFVRPAPWQRFLLERRNQQQLAAALEEVRPDVVSVWHMGGMSLGLLTALEARGLPVVLNVCDEWPAYGPRADAWAAAWQRRPRAVRRLVAAVTGVPTELPQLDEHVSSFVSAFTRDRLRERTPWRFPRHVVVGSGVDPGDFPPAPVEDRPWQWRLLGVGRLEPRKGFDVAVRALAELPEARLTLVGVADPRHSEELSQVADECGVADRLHVDAVPRARLKDLYRNADVVLFPSRWEEPFGLVPLEAMTQRTPVVATRRGGSAEFLADGTNCLEVAVDDPQGLARAVRRLADDPDLRAALVEAGTRTAAAYGVDRLAAALEALHREEADRRRGTTDVLTVEPVQETCSATWSAARADVSVVVATHDREHFLAELFSALGSLEQPPGGLEVVVADDGSSDGTWHELQRLVRAADLPVLALRLPATGGPSVPRNTAALRARGRVLAFTDDDCLPDPEWAVQLALPLLSGPGIVQGVTAPVPGVGLVGCWDRTVGVDAPTGLYETCNLGLDKGLFVRLGGFRPVDVLRGAARGFGEDAVLGAAAAREAAAHWAPGAVVRHRWLPGTYLDHLAGRRRLVGFPWLLGEVPELRRRTWRRRFLTRRTAAADAALLGVALSLGTRRLGPLVAAVPWLALALPDARARRGRPVAVRLAQLAVADGLGSVSLAEGSVRARRLLL